MKVLRVLVWTEGVTASKCVRFQTKLRISLDGALVIRLLENCPACYFAYHAVIKFFYREQASFSF